MVLALLDDLSETIPSGAHVVPVRGGAGYLTPGGLRPPSHITLVTLPHQSPELHPVKRLWLSLRQRNRSGRFYPDMGAV